jgi:hypothetical protein
MSRVPVRPRFRGLLRSRKFRLPARAAGTETASSVPRPVPLRRNKDFRMLWTGQLLSDTGSQIGGLASPLLILALTHSAVLAGVVGTVRAITGICFQLPAGAPHGLACGWPGPRAGRTGTPRPRRSAVAARTRGRSRPGGTGGIPGRPRTARRTARSGPRNRDRRGRREPPRTHGPDGPQLDSRRLHLPAPHVAARQGSYAAFRNRCASCAFARGAGDGNRTRTVSLGS